MKRWVALVALATTASSCGAAGGDTAASSPSPSPAAASPSPSPSGLTFKLNGINTNETGTINLVALALNQVVADGQGNADTKSTVTATYPPATGTWYVVVHAGPDMQGSNATYLLCGNLFA